ncbi:DUF2461 domain-containing protein [Christensenellaceae bacterium OttesenSCG-928-L17]|nr:DUF2461 domain-containing protein [Christensenellaceae bacterium OttesenSCG-928-L17]
MQQNIQPFVGLTPDTYLFFLEIAFHNDRIFFEENRERYVREVKTPMYALAAQLGATALTIDPSFDTRPGAVVSRIRRDTRFTKDKSPYRDHMFLSYKRHGMRTGESFVLYAEFENNAYGYGMGMYCPAPQYMADVRKRILARPALFLSLANDPAITSRFHLQGDDYKRPPCPDAPKELWPWLNKRNFSYCFSSDQLRRTMRPELVDEIIDGFETVKPLYRFIQGLDEEAANP